jgi:hypothetical protein
MEARMDKSNDLLDNNTLLLMIVCNNLLSICKAASVITDGFTKDDAAVSATGLADGLMQCVEFVSKTIELPAFPQKEMN